MQRQKDNTIRYVLKLNSIIKNKSFKLLQTKNDVYSKVKSAKHGVQQLMENSIWKVFA